MDVVDTSQLIARVSPRPAADRRLVFEPITAGFPFPAGVVRDPDRIGLLDDQGSPVAVQALATERWADGSVRWALLDFQAAGDVRDRQYTILCDAPVPQPLPRSRVEITEQDGGARVDTGAARFELRKGSSFPCAAASTQGVDAIDKRTRRVILFDLRISAVDLVERLTGQRIPEPGAAPSAAAGSRRTERERVSRCTQSSSPLWRT